MSDRWQPRQTCTKYRELHDTGLYGQFGRVTVFLCPLHSLSFSSHDHPLAVHARNRSSKCYCKRSDLVQAVNLDPNPKVMVSLALSTYGVTDAGRTQAARLVMLLCHRSSV